MEIEQLRKELNDLLENVVEHSSGYERSRKMPPLEISYVLSKINKMQETLILLKHLTNEEEKENRQQRVLAREVKEEVLIPEKPAVVPEQVDEVVLEEVIPEEIKETPAETEEAVVAEVEEPIAELEQEKESKPTINIEQMPIANLVDAFSLNDRYLFANELFNKDMGLFNDVVKKIESCSDFEAAKSILIEFGAQNDWDVESEHVLSFSDLVERRFL